ncbi:MAG: hypothetical protein DWQ53_23515 [Microcystis flos-aquae DF17]|jgi:hypothetical protein|nr:MAG: hypothetical protein DWQ53_23515 [Microcystis flos-aquae DF17]
MKKNKYKAELALIALLWFLVINIGNMGIIDTGLRLQMSHAWWTKDSEVQVTSETKPKIRGDIRFGVLGVDGKRYIAYEQGQSLLMLPGDLLGTWLHYLFPAIPEKNWRQLVVSFLIFIPLNIAAVLTCFWLLKEFGFNERIAQLGSVIFFLGTTFLHYAQIHQQNNQILLFVMIGYVAALAYSFSKNPSLAFMSGLALGGAMLMRITSLIHALSVFLFFLSCLIYQYRERLKQSVPELIKAIGIWILGFIPFTLIGRLFDYWRYGSFFMSGKKVEQIQLTTDPLWNGMPNLEPNYPFIYAHHVGFIGALFDPAKSIFIYDPLLLPCLVIAAILWKKINIYIRIYILVNILNLFLHLLAYSRFFAWGGDLAWGARYHVTSVQLLLIPLIGIFLQSLLSYRGIRRNLMVAIIAIAMVIQLASVTMHPIMEISQKNIGVPGTRLDFRLGQRMINLGCLLNSSLPPCQRATPEQREYLNAEFNRIIFLPFNWLHQAKDIPIFKSLGRIYLVFWFGILALAIFKTAQILAFSPEINSKREEL